MARVNSVEVQEIIEVQSSFDLTPVITIANELVTQFCTGDAVSSVYTSTRLKEIERWLAAHFYTVYEPRAESEKAGSVSQKLQSKVDLGLNSSHYGQTAMLLDHQGGLSRHSYATKTGRKTSGAGISYLGTLTDDQARQQENFD